MAIRRNNSDFKGRDSKKDFRRDEKPAGSTSYFKKKEGDRENKPFRKSDERRGPASFHGKREAGDRDEKPFRKSFGDRNERPSERPSSYKGKRSYNDREEKPIRKSYGDRNERPSERPSSYKGKKSYSDREEKPFRKTFGNRNERPSERPSSYKGKRSYSDREEKPIRKTFGDRNERASERPSSYKGKRSYSDKEEKPFKKNYEQRFSTREEGDEIKGQKRMSKKSYSKTKHSAENKDDGLIRLNKFISNSGICSRREADEFITAGLITVNGEVVTTLGTKVKITDDIRYNGTRMKSERMVYVLLNKPKDYITTTDDPQQRKTVMELVASACKERIYPVGRLDRNTTGLLLLTNDGELADKLTHPSTNVKKTYMVELNKNLKPADMQKIADGLQLEDGFMQVDEIAFDEAANSKRVVGVTLHSGRNRIVRRLFEHLGYMVVKLDRTYYAGLTKRDLPRGRYRHLDEMEVNMLKMLRGR